MSNNNQLIQLAQIPVPTDKDMRAAIQECMFHYRNNKYKEGLKLDSEMFMLYINTMKDLMDEQNWQGALVHLGLFYNHIQSLPRVR